MSITVPRLDLEAIVAVAGGFREAHDDVYGSRQERKLVVPIAVVAPLRAALANHLHIEEFVAGRQRSLIHSVYLDTPDFALYRGADQPGSPNVKLRLRTYGDAATPGRTDGPTYLEAKVGLVSSEGVKLKRKARLPLTGPQLDVVLNVPGAAEKLRTDTRKKFWKPVLKQIATHAIGPCLTVSYEREAWIDETGFLRVTIDEGYIATAVQAGGCSPIDACAGRLPHSAIVELKFVGSVPAWLEAVIIGLGLRPEGESFSKFKTAVPLLFPPSTYGGNP